MGMSGISNLLNKELMDQVSALSDGTFFAIKVLTDNDDHRDEIKFCRDVAALLAKDPNEHLVRIYATYLLKETSLSSPDGFTGRYIPFLQMEWSDGTLRHKLNEFGDADISEEEISGYLLQILVGLKYLHSHKRVHRDLKPSNSTSPPFYQDEDLISLSFSIVQEGTVHMSRLSPGTFGLSTFPGRLWAFQNSHGERHLIAPTRYTSIQSPRATWSWNLLSRVRYVEFWLHYFRYRLDGKTNGL
jgi:serine/threonine protein kinase